MPKAVLERRFDLPKARWRLARNAQIRREFRDFMRFSRIKHNGHYRTLLKWARAFVLLGNVR